MPHRRRFGYRPAARRAETLLGLGLRKRRHAPPALPAQILLHVLVCPLKKQQARHEEPTALRRLTGPVYVLLRRPPRLWTVPSTVLIWPPWHNLLAQ